MQRLWLGFVFLVLLTPASSRGADRFDAGHAAASTHSGRTLKWHHLLGDGPSRVLVVAISTVDNQSRDPRPAVTFNGTAMQQVAGARAVTNDGTPSLRTQLFYLLDARLPAAGTYEVSVSLQETVSELGGGSLSLTRIAQTAPESVAANTSALGAGGVATPLTVHTPRAWIVEAVGADGGGALSPAGTEQARWYAAEGRRLSVAGSAARATETGARTLGWTEDGGGRIAHVAAAFAPLQYPLTVTVNGAGSVVPPGGVFSDGELVALSAVPAAGYALIGWSGDASGSANPATILMDGPKQVTATFDLAVPDFEALVGWATADGGVTGGEGGAEVVVDTLAALKQYAARPEPYIIKISGTIRGNEAVRVQSNKSILGLGSTARLLGVGLQIGYNTAPVPIHNVIVRNIAFEKALAPIDPVSVQYRARNVWIDHCDFSSDRAHGIDFYDGLLDVTHGADFITVSWSRFHDHFKTSLVGNSDDATDDPGHLTVTYHHNSFIDSGGRNPSVRFGHVHLFNNYYKDLDDYGVASRMGAEVVVENNWFENVRRPIRADTSLSPIAGFVRGEETNAYVNSGANSITSPPATWLPPYSYSLDPVNIVPESVARWAGVGVVTFTGDPPAPSAPIVTVQPLSQEVDAGANVAFVVEADGTFPFTYRWFKDGALVADAADPILSLTAVDDDDAGTYTVEVSNAAGSATSEGAVLTIKAVPPPVTTSSILRERFADGARTNQALPDSAAWFTSSGSGNLTVVNGELVQITTASRTLLAHFTNDQGLPVTLNDGESLRLGFTFRFTAFDPVSDNLRVGLLRSVANPNAVSGAGFVPAGSPNSNARVSGDFGSNGPTSNVFLLYSGYAAFTNVSAAASPAPIRFLARTGANATLIGGTGAYTNLPNGAPAPSTAMEGGTLYRGTLVVTRTGTDATVSLAVARADDGTLVMSHSATHAGASMASFDTAAFYLGRSSVSFDFVLTEVDVERLTR